MRPRLGWLRAFEAALLPRLASFTSRDFAQCLWALQKLQHVPPPSWTRAFLAAMRPHVGTFGVQSACMILLALGQLRDHLVPDDPVLAALCRTVQPQLPLLPLHLLASLAGALARLRYTPPAPFHRQLLLATDAALRNYYSSPVAPPPQSLLQPSLQPQQTCVKAVPPSAFPGAAAAPPPAPAPAVAPSGLPVPARFLCTLAWSTCTLAAVADNPLHMRRELALLPRFAEVSGRMLAAGALNSVDLHMLVVGFAAVHYAPPPPWLDMHETTCCVLGQAGHFNSLQLLVVCRAYGALGHEGRDLRQVLRRVRGSEAHVDAVLGAAHGPHTQQLREGGSDARAGQQQRDEGVDEELPDQRRQQQRRRQLPARTLPSPPPPQSVRSPVAGPRRRAQVQAKPVIVNQRR